jgi:phage shock protein PspC (stress-responsive transcriptional regulator)
MGKGGSSDLGRYRFTTFMHALTKSNTDKWIGGVCGGLGDHSDIPSWVWRALFLFALSWGGISLFVYLILWICLPKAGAAPKK